MNHYQININEKGYYGRTPLHYCSLLGNESTVSALLSMGADDSALDSFGYSPLALADQRGEKEVVNGYY